MHALLMWVISTRMPAHFKYYIDTNGMSPSVIPFNYNHPITSDTWLYNLCKQIFHKQTWNSDNSLFSV